MRMVWAGTGEDCPPRFGRPHRPHQLVMSRRLIRHPSPSALVADSEESWSDSLAILAVERLLGATVPWYAMPYHVHSMGRR